MKTSLTSFLFAIKWKVFSIVNVRKIIGIMTLFEQANFLQNRLTI